MRVRGSRRARHGRPITHERQVGVRLSRRRSAGRGHEATRAPLGANDQAAEFAGRSEIGLEAEDAAEGLHAGLAWRCEEQLRIGSEEFAGALEWRLADAVPEQAVSADADKASGEHVLQKRPAERRRGGARRVSPS